VHGRSDYLLPKPKSKPESRYLPDCAIQARLSIARHPLAAEALAEAQGLPTALRDSMKHK